MSYANLLRNAATTAANTLAQLQGMADGGTNTLINGAAYVGVYGSPEVDETANPAGGRQRLAQTWVRLTRTQFDAPPQSNIQITRTDTTPRIVYRVASVDTHDPLFYVLMLAKVGA